MHFRELRPNDLMEHDNLIRVSKVSKYLTNFDPSNSRHLYNDILIIKLNINIYYNLSLNI